MGLVDQDLNILDCYKKIEVHGEGEKNTKCQVRHPTHMRSLTVLSPVNESGQ
jgi:hypothetical protein